MNSSQRRLSSDTRAAILARKGTGETQLSVAADFDVSDATVWNIWNPDGARAMRRRAYRKRADAARQAEAPA